MSRETSRARALSWICQARTGGVCQPIMNVMVAAVYDVCQYRVHQVVARGCGIHQDEPVRVGVYAALQGQVHEDTAGQGILQGPVGQAQNLPALVFQQQQQQFFCESQQKAIPLLTRPKLLTNSATASIWSLCATTLWSRVPGSGVSTHFPDEPRGRVVIGKKTTYLSRIREHLGW